METHKENLTAIAEAIREKDGSTEPIVANEFAQRIQELPMGMDEETADKRYLKLTGGKVENPDGSRVNVCAPENTDWLAPLEVREGEYGLQFGGDVIGADAHGKLTVDLAFDKDSVRVEKSDGPSKGTISAHVEENNVFLSVDEHGGNSCAMYADGIERQQKGTPVGGLYIEEGKIRFHSNDASGSEIPAVLSGLAEPVLEDEAATKKYVDDKGKDFVSKTSTISQELNCVFGTHGSGNRLYAVDELGRESSVGPGWMSIADWSVGDTGIEAALDVREDENTKEAVLGVSNGASGENIIIRGLSQPQEPTDATTKKYVDEKVDGKFLPLDGGGKIQSTSSESAALINGDEVSVGTPNGDLGIVAPNFIGVMDSKLQRGAIFKEVEDGMLVGCADETPISIVNLAEPVRDDAAATKKYVDTLGRNTVKQTGELKQNVDGSLLLNPNLQGDPPYLLFNPSEDCSCAELRAEYLYFERWYDGISDFALAIYPRSRDESNGTGPWTPVLEFEDSGFGGPGVILAGVNTPTEDYDAANKKYVDESVMRFAENGGLWGVRETGYKQMLAHLPEFFQDVYEAGARVRGLTNGIKDPTFSETENSPWVMDSSDGSVSIVPGKGLVGNNALRVMVNGQKIHQIIADSSKKLIAGHAYFVSAYYFRGSGMGISTFSIKKKVGDEETVVHTNSKAVGSIGEWRRSGFIFTAPPEEEYDELSLHLGVTGTVGITRYIDGIVLLDLTTAWGEGNEPDLDWCLNNLPFFEGAGGSSNKTYIPKKFATASDVDTAINTAVGDISALLDAINGEVV